MKLLIAVSLLFLTIPCGALNAATLLNSFLQESALSESVLSGDEYSASFNPSVPDVPVRERSSSFAPKGMTIPDTGGDRPSFGADVPDVPIVRFKKRNRDEYQLPAVDTTTDSTDVFIDWAEAEKKAKRYTLMGNMDRNLSDNMAGRELNQGWFDIEEDREQLDAARWWMEQRKDPLPTVRHRVLKPTKEPLQILSTIRVPENITEYKNQLAEIRWFKQFGYTHVLVAYGGEINRALLLVTLRTLSAEGWKFVFAPMVRHHDTLYKPPDYYIQAFSEILPYCDFSLCGWRSLSNTNHWTDDKTRDEADDWEKGVSNRLRDVTVLASLIRKARPAIPIIGESWVWRPDEIYQFEPDWVGGLLIGGTMGFIQHGISPSPAGLADLMDTDNSLMALVTGIQPYTLPENGKEKLLRNALKLHKKFTGNSQYIGTITMIGAGGAWANALTRTDYRRTCDLSPEDL